MPKVILKGPLISQFNFREIYVNDRELLRVLVKIDSKKHLILNESNQLKSGILILINGKDWRLYRNQLLNDNDIIEIIPINHGG
ncbi:hypothetical protein SULI_06450 [Saccharolobus solfataricus]|uniref:Ubiquitin n=3 Tax=Saccharolobus solfataricus TaxID=2287 RepID=Q980K8_SACS2|nr:hypothetical protein [Saccharolobus solfataricus]AAK40623.1 Hypothetical protein SSO5559 [Saccharolobus solfataricus P2]AKA73600.1 hypothetical protein SULB_1303 [Saccharolobus solfataricus]AKA76298.1 hypothetical protein SULC_1301 [Saccharolobus solfataricus]AKA78990.1 hypothetical protein SULA_1302 [Saccharolobus solfataricus]AZF68068.1 hypothetical protein SULG_06450 [Saccharolobus solfataricus]